MANEESRQYQMIYPECRRVDGEEIVRWAMDIAEDEGIEMPGSVEEAKFLLQDRGLATFAK